MFPALLIAAVRSPHRPVRTGATRRLDESDEIRAHDVRQLEQDVQPRFEAEPEKARGRVHPGELSPRRNRHANALGRRPRAERSALPLRARADQDEGQRQDGGRSCDRSRASRRPAEAVDPPRQLAERPVLRSRVDARTGGSRSRRSSSVQRRIGEHRVAVILPTLTWQAYNFRDDDGDGASDTWYADRRRRSVRLARPFRDRGVPLRFRSYDLPFLHWLAWNGKPVDYLAQADLERISDARRLRRAYDLIIFPGHHEYVTSREYGLVRAFAISAAT